VRGTPDLKIDFHTAESFKYSNNDFFFCLFSGIYKSFF